jgi:hypothetical protein
MSSPRYLPVEWRRPGATPTTYLAYATLTAQMGIQFGRPTVLEHILLITNTIITGAPVVTINHGLASFGALTPSGVNEVGAVTIPAAAFPVGMGVRFSAKDFKRVATPPTPDPNPSGLYINPGESLTFTVTGTATGTAVIFLGFAPQSFQPGKFARSGDYGNPFIITTPPDTDKFQSVTKA